MNKKWFLIGTFLSAMLAGCNVDPDPDPAPPEVEDQAPADEDTNGGNDGTNDIPGVDENDNMTKDDEKDTDPDSEDPIEDPEDIQDEDNRDD